MKKFKEIKKTGDGTFGVVIKAQDLQTMELVAIKKMKQKYHNFEECTNLREVKALMKLQNHPNIVKLKEVFLDGETLCLVFEFVEKSIYQQYLQFKDQGKYMPEDQIKSIIYQCANGLAFMHKHGYFHRDLKPENLLISNGVLKVIDFGLAREIRSRPPYTDYVATRWYRAPEILLKQLNYNSPVDIFALGCIMAELYLNRPLFSGTSEMDQFHKILSTLGTFTAQEWPEGSRLVSQLGITLTQYQPLELSKIIPNGNPDAWNLISQMIRWNPVKRITAQQILSHPYFYNIQNIVPAIVLNNEEVPQPTQQTQQTQPIQQKQEQPQKIQKQESNEFDDLLESLSEPGTKAKSDYIPQRMQQQQKPLHHNFSVPQQQTQPQVEKKQSNSIYNFDNYKPDIRVSKQQSNAQLPHKQY